MGKCHEGEEKCSIKFRFAFILQHLLISGKKSKLCEGQLVKNFSFVIVKMSGFSKVGIIIFFYIIIYFITCQGEQTI